MSPQSFVMPILALVVALVSLFTSPEKLKRRSVLALFLIVLLVTCALQILFNYTSESSSARRQRWSDDRIRELTSTLASFRAEANTQLAGITGLLRSYGWSAPRLGGLRTADRSLEAAQARARLAAATAGESRSGVTVQYFPKDVDRQTVEGALRDLGFRLQAGPTQVPDVPTNTIWYGSQVPRSDVLLVALTLMRAGIEMKAIEPFSSSTGRATLIQVGADRTYQTRPALTVTQVQEQLGSSPSKRQ
jgi:hypothetical protein